MNVSERPLLLLTGWLALGLAVSAVAQISPSGSKPVPLMERSGNSYAAAVDLVAVGIAVKSLPGQKMVTVCLEERCAMVKEFRLEGKQLLVMVGPMAKALGLKMDYAVDRKQASFSIEPMNDPVATGTVKVGQLAPDFRLMKLDGTPVSLSDFRGRRVLINSWASW